MQPLLSSIQAPVVFEAAQGILSLASVATSGSLAAAPTMAVGALVDLWDHDSTETTHSQIIDVLTANLGALQVCACPESYLFLARQASQIIFRCHQGTSELSVA